MRLQYKLVMAKTDYYKEFIIRSIKIADMGYIYALLGSAGILEAIGLNSLFGRFDPDVENQKSTIRIAVEILMMLWLNGIIIYITINLLELFPSPLDGLYGYNHLRTFQKYSLVPMSIALLFFQAYYLSKILNFRNRLSPSTPLPSEATPTPNT